MNIILIAEEAEAAVEALDGYLSVHCNIADAVTALAKDATHHRIAHAEAERTAFNLRLELESVREALGDDYKQDVPLATLIRDVKRNRTVTAVSACRKVEARDTLGNVTSVFIGQSMCIMHGEAAELARKSTHVRIDGQWYVKEGPMASLFLQDAWLKISNQSTP